MKKKKWFEVALSAALIYTVLLSACGPADLEHATGVPEKTRTPQTPSPAPSVSLQPESEPPSAESSVSPKIMASGVCGENATWSLDEEGTLTISGSGRIYGYMEYCSDSELTCEDPSHLNPPWNETYDNQSIRRVIIEPGITSIGVGAFMLCPRLETASIPSGVTKLGSSAFAACPMLTSIELPTGTVEVDE